MDEGQSEDGGQYGVDRRTRDVGVDIDASTVSPVGVPVSAATSGRASSAPRRVS